MTDTKTPEPTLPHQARNPLHGVTLEAMVTALVEAYGWAGLGQRIPIRCFVLDPSVRSSLTFLRRTPWARAKVEGLYLFMLREAARTARANRPPGRRAGQPPADQLGAE
jgi:uncharacterized protein (DUF2132 family)